MPEGQITIWFPKLQDDTATALIETLHEITETVDQRVRNLVRL